MSDQFDNIIWTASPSGFTAYVAELTLSIVRVSTERAISQDRKVLAFTPHRYRAFVDDAVVDPKNIFYTDLNEAKTKTIGLAQQIARMISEKRAKRRAEMLAKFQGDD